jgi:hypothetical protein
MGRRSRKRSGTPGATPPARSEAAGPAAPPPRAPRTATYKARLDDAPKPAWAPFPLTELCILIAIVLLAIGFFTGGDRRAPLLGAGIVLVTLAAGELAVREHFSGYRSHTSLLAGMCAVLVAGLLWFATVPQVVILPIAVLAFGGAFFAFRRAFVRRSGGVGFRA